VRVSEIGTRRDLCLDTPARLDEGALSFLYPAPPELLVLVFSIQLEDVQHFQFLGSIQDFVVSEFGLDVQRGRSGGLTGHFAAQATQPLPTISYQIRLLTNDSFFEETTSGPSRSVAD
jgi:hypothetical protein